MGDARCAAALARVAKQSDARHGLRKGGRHLKTAISSTAPHAFGHCAAFRYSTGGGVVSF